MRWIIRIVSLFVFLAVLAVGALFVLPADRIAALASDQLRAFTGREVTLSGRLRPTIWPQIGVTTGPVALSNPDWAGEVTMLQAEGLSVGLDLKALLRGSVQVKKLEITAPRINLLRAEDGRVNWDFDIGSGTPTGRTAPDSPGGFTLDMARISDGAISYTDRTTGMTQKLAALDATLRLPAYAGPAQVEMSADLNGQPVTATAEIGAFGPFIGGSISSLTADLTAGATKIRFDGRGGMAPLNAEGELDADIADMAAMFRAAGIAPPHLPPELVRGLRATGRLTYAPEGTLHLRDGVLSFGGNQMNGSADLTLSDRPRLTAEFASGALDLSALFSPADADSGDADTGSGPGWSKAPIDLSALGVFDADLALTADSIDLGRARLGPTRARATLTDRRVVLNLLDVAAYDGRITGNIVVNGRGDLSVGGDLSASGLNARPLLADLADYDRLSTSAGMSLNFLGSGNSVDAIMNSLSGKGSVALGQGALTGIDLAAIFRSGDTSAGGGTPRTIFDAVTVSYVLDGGVMTFDDLLFDAPLLTATGAGTVDIGQQALDVRIVPTAFSGPEGSGGVKVPLRIAGPWSGPRLALDIAAISAQPIEKAREDLKARAAEELDALEGESLEDAARRKLKEEAGRGILNLLTK